MRFRYSQTETPPNLIVPVVLTDIAPGLVVDADAKIDTGADLTLFPSALRRSLGLRACGLVTTRGALAEKWDSILTFWIRIRIAGGPWIAIVAAESPKPYMLLGRDVLNQCILTANGPAGHFDLDLPQP